MATRLNKSAFTFPLTGMAFSKDGRLYLDVGVFGRGENVVEIDTATGAIIRTAASGLPQRGGLATDPLSGDLFASTGRFDIFRISNFANGPGTVTSYASVAADGLVFGPDG